VATATEFWNSTQNLGLSYLLHCELYSVSIAEHKHPDNMILLL